MIQQQPRWRVATAWLAQFRQNLRELYTGLSKAESTALFLLRTEVIGLNGWLTSIQVPGLTVACQCGYAVQTVRHILLHCPRFNRLTLITQCGTERLETMLNQPASAQLTARWFIQAGVLEQF